MDDFVGIRKGNGLRGMDGNDRYRKDKTTVDRYGNPGKQI